ncbi:MAG: hypothetical protein BWX54_02404 [Verrucomicrobia bacterium ADurb.Bin018]|nr:MAG: hypothetical protein BWX54_02404 [Verrucomicrobia bacterium ADurb.Bin018]
MTFFDFIFQRLLRTVFLRSTAEKAQHERRPDRVRPTHGRTAQIRIRQVRPPLRRQPSRALAAHLRAVPRHGVRPADLSRELARHHHLSRGRRPQTLSQRHPPNRGPQHAGRCQRETRLAHLRRLRPRPDRAGCRSLCRRTFWGRTQTGGLCPGLDHHRFVSLAFPVGQVPPPQGRDQAAYPADLARQLSHRGHSHAGQGSRREHPRRSQLRGGLVLHYGSRLSGLCALAPAALLLGLFRHPGQTQLPFPAPLLAPGGQTHGPAFRPDGYPDGLLCPARLSRAAAPHRLSRPADRQGTGVSHQQLHRTGSDHRATLPLPVAYRTVFQMDQAAFADQSVLWHLGQRRAHSNLDCDQRLSARRHPQEATAAPGQPLHHSTDFQHHSFRENAHFTGSFSNTTTNDYA